MTNRLAQRRELIRMAVGLRERLITSRKSEIPVLPQGSWSLCQRLFRRFEIAQRRGWIATAERIRPRMQKVLRDLEENLALTRRWQTQQSAKLCPSLRELHAMIHQFARWLRGLPLDRDLSLNLLASEIVLS